MKKNEAKQRIKELRKKTEDKRRGCFAVIKAVNGEVEGFDNCGSISDRVR